LRRPNEPAELLARLQRREIAEPVAVGAISLIVFAISAHGRRTFYNNYVLLADAFLHGRVAISWPGRWIDAVDFHGAHYVIEGPAPAFLMLPQVALSGTSANQTVTSLAVGAVAMAAAAVLLMRLGVAFPARVWLLLFLAAGTDLWWASQLGDVWMFAHVCAVAFTLMALIGAVGWRHPWLVGGLAGLAVLSRFPLLLAVPFFVYVAWRNSRRAALLFVAGMAPLALFWLWYNEVRWGTWLDVGYVLFYRQDVIGSPTGVPFQLKYLPYQLHSFFVQGPDLVAQWPFVIPSLSGVALTFTSPALLFAAWARRPLLAVGACWGAAALVAAPSFLYYTNGYAQYGMRHALDFEPFLFVLMALAARGGLPLAARAATAWSCAVGTYGVWYWTTITRPGN
jgi:hypothetical protein